jgi:hypothetical protein
MQSIYTTDYMPMTLKNFGTYLAELLENPGRSGTASFVWKAGVSSLQKL